MCNTSQQISGRGLHLESVRIKVHKKLSSENRFCSQRLLLYSSGTTKSKMSGVRGGLRCSSAVVGSFSNKNSSCWAVQLLSVVAYNTSGLVALNALLGPHGRSSFGSAVMKAVSSIPTAFWQGSPSAKETVAANQIVQDFMQHCSNLNYSLARIQEWI